MRLLNLIAGWKLHHVAEGVTLLPPQGMTVGAVQVKEKVRPLRSMALLLEDLLRQSAPALRDSARVGAVERFTTIEGEFVALGGFVGSVPGEGRVERIVAQVLADDYYALVDGIVRGEEHAATFREIVRTLAENYFLGLGEIRRRPFVYEPPPGWRGVAAAHATHWYAPEFPRAPGVIHVFHARPAKITFAEAEDRALFLENLSVVDRDPPHPARPVRSQHGLVGQITAITGRTPKGERAALYQATLLDPRYAYLVQLETTVEKQQDTLPAFLRLVDSVMPLPLPSKKKTAASLVHWAD